MQKIELHLRLYAYYYPYKEDFLQISKRPLDELKLQIDPAPIDDIFDDCVH